MMVIDAGLVKQLRETMRIELHNPKFKELLGEDKLEVWSRIEFAANAILDLIKQNEQLEASLLAMTTWQPISAAPTDGTPIVGVIEGRDEAGKPFIPFVCWWVDVGWVDETDTTYYPTHFVPIQTPPAKEGEDNV
jgi:hypothetical protein